MAISSQHLDVILAARLTAVQRLLWIAVRSRQGRDLLPVAITRRELAEAVGTDKALVVRAVSALKDEGWMDESPAGLSALVPGDASGVKMTPTTGVKNTPESGVKTTPAKANSGVKNTPIGVKMTPQEKKPVLIEGLRYSKTPSTLRVVSPTDESGEEENSRVPAPNFDLSLSPYEIYLQVPAAVRSLHWQDLITQSVPDDDYHKALWMEVCLTWSTSKKPGGGRYNMGNVRDMINHYKRNLANHEEAQRTTGGRTDPSRRSGTASERAGRASTHADVDDCHTALAIVRARRG